MLSILTENKFTGGRGNGSLFFSDFALSPGLDSRIIVASLIKQKVGVLGL